MRLNFLYVPFRKDVRLTRLNLTTGDVAAMTGVFSGGQRTINMLSWSPAGSEFAFVSYRWL